MAGVPSRGEVWLADLDPVRGHGQGRRRPCVIVSDDTFNHGPAGMVVVVPLTTTGRGVPLHVVVDPPDGGVRARSFIKCEDIRSISVERLIDHWGAVSDAVMRDVAALVQNGDGA